jgi:hypothetical protein
LNTTIIGTNNIFIDQATVQERANDFCNVTACPSWLKVKKNLPEKGFIFCCEMNDDLFEMLRFQFVFSSAGAPRLSLFVLVSVTILLITFYFRFT